MKKILSLAMVGVMMFSALPMAYAADGVCSFCGVSYDGHYDQCMECDGLGVLCAACDKCSVCNADELPPANNDYTQGTKVIYTADSEANEKYTITVPALLAPGNEGTVTLEGTWASDRKVTVTADATVTLANSINAADTKTLDVTFAGISKKGNNTTSQTFTEAVAVADIENAIFGTWSGQFNYNVEIADVIISFTIDGTPCQAEEGMTWGEWIESEYNTVGVTLNSQNVSLDGKGLIGPGPLNSGMIITAGTAYTKMT